MIYSVQTLLRHCPKIFDVCNDGFVTCMVSHSGRVVKNILILEHFVDKF